MRSIFFVGFLFLFSGIKAQFVQVGNGSYLGTLAGPIRVSNTSDTFISRYAYIYPKSELGNLTHGDSIASIAFYKADGDPFNGNIQMRVWVANTSSYDFGASPISFSTKTSNAQLVFKDHPSTVFSENEGFYTIPFTKSFYYDSVTNGENLAVFVECVQTDTQGDIYNFYFEGSNTVSSFYSPQVKYYVGVSNQDSLKSSSEYHPTIILNYPRFTEDAMIRGVYTLGKMPIPLGNPDSVKTLVRNVGKQEIKNLKCYTYSRGNNTQLDSFSISLKQGEEKFVMVPSLSPTKKGFDTVYVEATDSNHQNNTAFSYRLGNPNIYSYRDVTQSPAGGGIGFNGAQGDFVARFHSNNKKNLNQITVVFSGSGRLFQLGIWEHDTTKAQPGKELFISDSLYSQQGTYIFDLPQPVQVNGSFYVGVRQLDLNNVGFGFQFEQPVRPQTFFYTSPAGDTNWVDFHPNAPYRFVIEPRLQADYDYTVLSAKPPKDTLNIYDKDSFIPEVTVSNIGVYKTADSFTVRCVIRGLNQLHYNEVIYDTLSPGLSRTYTFNKTFIPEEFGQHTMWVIVTHYLDEIQDNDTLVYNFYSGVTQDVMLRTLYDPKTGGVYLFEQDTIMPLAAVLNLGYDDTKPFNVYCQIFHDTNKIYEDVQTISLKGFFSQVLFWKTYKCTDTGTLRFLFFTSMSGDRYPFNDTLSSTIVVYKQLDIVSDTIFSPNPDSTYSKYSDIDVVLGVKNEGVMPSYDTRYQVDVFDPSNQRVYTDSFKVLYFGMEAQTKSTKTFKPSGNGIYSIRLLAHDTLDKYPYNDTLVQMFTVGNKVDVEVDSIGIPSVLSSAGNGVIPVIKLKNNGFSKGDTTVRLKLEIFRNQVKWHSETLDVDLYPESKQIILLSKSFKPFFTGTYQAVATIFHPSDEVSTNDTLLLTFEVVIGKDPLLVNILPNYDSSILYKNYNLDSFDVLVKNQGTDTVFGVNLYFDITHNKAIVFKDYQKRITLAPDQEKVVKYVVGQQISSLGEYKIHAVVDYAEDQDNSNDTLIHRFELRSKYDLAILAVDSPKTSGFYVTNTKYYPRVTMANLGQDSNTRPATLLYTAQKNGSPWYTEEIPVPVIMPGDSLVVQATQVLFFQETGTYNFLLYNKDHIDEDLMNDTLSFTLIIQQNQVAEENNTMNIYPNPITQNNFEISGLNIDNLFLYDATGRNTEINWTSSGRSSAIVSLGENTTGGIYYVIVQTKEGLTFQRQVVVLD